MTHQRNACLSRTWKTREARPGTQAGKDSQVQTDTKLASELSTDRHRDSRNRKTKEREAQALGH